MQQLVSSSSLAVVEIPAVQPAVRSFQVSRSTPIIKSKGVLWYPDRPPWVVSLIQEGDAQRLVCTCPFCRRYHLPCSHLLCVTGGVFGLSDVHYRYLLDYVLGHLASEHLLPPKRGIVISSDVHLSFPESTAPTLSALLLSEDDDNSDCDLSDFGAPASDHPTVTQDYRTHSEFMSQLKAVFKQLQSNDTARQELMILTKEHVATAAALAARIKATPSDPSKGVQDPCSVDKSKGRGSSRRLGASPSKRSKRRKIVVVGGTSEDTANPQPTSQANPPSPATAAAGVAPASSAPTEVQDPPTSARPGRPALISNEELALGTVQWLGRKRRQQLALTAASVSEQKTPEWHLFKIGHVSGTTAQTVVTSGRGLAACARKILGLSPEPRYPLETQKAIDLGVLLEPRILKWYQLSVRKSTICKVFLYPAVIRHEIPELGVVSPDGVVFDVETKTSILLEVKTTKQILTAEQAANKPQWYSQLQLGMWALKAQSAILLVYDTNLATTTDDHQAKILEGAVKQIPVNVDLDWREKFSCNATAFYDAYLRWYHELFDSSMHLQDEQVRKGVAVLEMLIDKAPPEHRPHLLRLCAGVTHGAAS